VFGAGGGGAVGRGIGASATTVRYSSAAAVGWDSGGKREERERSSGTADGTETAGRDEAGTRQKTTATRVSGGAVGGARRWWTIGEIG
jgi:hypothetical protein